MKKQVLELKQDVKSAGATYDELIFEKVAPAELWCIQTGSFVDHTTSFTKLQIFRRTGDQDEELEEEPSPAADELYWLDKQYYLREGQRLVARLTGCTSSDLLTGWLRGYRVEA